MNSLSSQALLEIVSSVDLYNLMEGGRANFKLQNNEATVWLPSPASVFEV